MCIITITQKVVDSFVDPALEYSNKKALDEKKNDIKVVGWQRMGIAKIVTMIVRLYCKGIGDQVCIPFA